MKLLEDNLDAHGQAADWKVPVAERPFGEARTIFDGKGRFVSILGTNPLFHHPEDHWPDAIDPPRTVALTRAMLQVAKHLSAS